VSASGQSADRWLVAGRVQGVGFRWFVLRRAEELDLAGWVSNLADGRVEVVASGTAPARDRLDELLRHGPRLSKVDHVERTSYPHDMHHVNGFEIR
jgi:acylphosphatase